MSLIGSIRWEIYRSIPDLFEGIGHMSTSLCLTWRLDIYLFTDVHKKVAATAVTSLFQNGHYNIMAILGQWCHKLGRPFVYKVQQS